MNGQGLRDPNRLKQNLANGKVCIGATITLNSTVIAELMSHIGLDWLWFEMEHSALSEENVLQMLQATNGSEASMVVRVPWNDKTMIKRVLDTGPDGIIIPLVNSAEEAQAAVLASKYPPLGERGAGLARAQAYGLHMSEYLQSADDEVMVIAMIEHIKAVDNIEEILAVKGVDSIMIGGLDLSGSMGVLGQTDHPDVERAIQRVLSACKAAGVPPGIVTVTPEDANRRIEQGFTNLIIGIDVLYMVSAISSAIAQIKRPVAA
jgi:2-dehydro-3-deoxyglucarate aldolase/4-hydroxy-2-oxoheptanedioate aldolase